MTTKLEQAQIKLLEAQTRQIEAETKKDERISAWYNAKTEELKKSTKEIDLRIKEKYGDDD